MDNELQTIKTSDPATTSPVRFDHVLEFIRGASPQELRKIVTAVRAARKRSSMRTSFKPGDEVKWTIEGKTLGQFFQGTMLKTNITTCTVAVKRGEGPRSDFYRVPFEFVRRSQ